MASYPRTRSREEKELFDSYQWFSGTGVTTYPDPYVLPPQEKTVNVEYCDDEIHTQYPNEGGPFCVRKTTYTPNRMGYAAKAGYSYSRVSSGITTYYVGLQRDGLISTPPAGASVPTKDSAINGAKAYGAEAWNRFSPKPYVSNLGQFFGELKESFRMLYDVRRLAMPHTIASLSSLRNLRLAELRNVNIRLRSSWPVVWRFLRSTLKDSSKGYLAMEFGWKPFISDFAKLIRSVSKYDQRLTKIRNEVGKWVRRGGTLRDNTSAPVRSMTYTGLKHNVINASMWVNPTYYYETTSHERVWFKGKFRYFIPGLDDQSFVGQANRLRRLYGLEITPWLIWKLTPWSWMADWFSNVDHILGNISDIMSHEVIAKYAYVMRETTVSRNLIYSVYGKYRGAYTPSTYTTLGPYIGITNTTVNTKTRVAASPFGFDVDWPDFDNWRLSILAALGISRAL